MLDIITLGDEVLKEKCTPVETFDNALRMLVDAMFETLVEADGVGLAAPQVGVLKRLFVIEIRDEVKQVFINPQIIQTSVETCVMEEGCLSIPGIWHDITRPEKITVQAQDVDGKPFTVTAGGLYARAIQHEYDHLNGVLFIDHLDKAEEEKVVESYQRKHRKDKKKRKV
ncbi:MAG: peptide deformylase [Sphaerochaeta sp.]|jgi:peptide deformylase|nr:peptide deformylase [Sphaerochaeta sp.]MCH3919013.1 peptide deformylase [Sphaerochaeta sp.]MCI2044910.1 peptide deformylase [Sphaerochaeta sp.]MCI2075783.1 peptide deformylase [Sphaerochaeta sp.]MCI2096444.1 peptide deformylase [Sphaerochaeta sp.]